LNLAATNRPTMAFYGIADRRCVTQVSFADLVAADDQQRAIADLDEVFKTGQSKDVDYQMVSATGDDKHVKFSLSGILSEGGNAHEIMAIAHEPDASDLAGDRPINLLWFERVIADTAHIVQSIIKTEDPFIADHQERVAKLAAALAEDLGLPKEEIEGVYVAANFHDIGKFFVPTQILSKPEKLTHKERQVMQRHVNPGHDILSYIKFRWPVATAVSQHHERLDGSGYPAGLKGDDISLEARILAVADVMEAMASDRPYREGLGVDAALTEISQNSGVLYDSTVAESCARLFKEKDFQF
ncbi:MAG: HD domain-containing protein, partial [Actinomycetia bacterium]|nr:HD domain-containing protein [Actinomycetes bacterium]